MSNKIVATRFPDVVTDNGICDVARVSFRKEASQFTGDQNHSLLRYLFSHVHWSPFGHARLNVVTHIGQSELLKFLLNAQLAGFKYDYHSLSGRLELNGSLWAFYENYHHLPLTIVNSIVKLLFKKFPVSCRHMWTTAEPDMLADKYALEVQANSTKMIHASFRCEAPFYVVRQLGKHQVGLCWNEVSRRYVADIPEHYDIDAWRRKPEGSIKQGSGEVFEPEQQSQFNWQVGQLRQMSDILYSQLIIDGVAPELARSCVLMDVQTEWIWTGSLLDWARVCKQRIYPNAQKESRMFAEQVDSQLSTEFGTLWTSLR